MQPLRRDQPGERHAQNTARLRPLPAETPDLHGLYEVFGPVRHHDQHEDVEGGAVVGFGEGAGVEKATVGHAGHSFR
jgi:hypothetical protein